ncbi:MAG: hypothetical protein ACRD59_01310 [Candidatus Acidiferrales bacterium]
MNVNSVEQSLARYHLLHLVIGAILGAVLLAIPKLAGVLFCVFLVAMLLPSVILPDFQANKWYDRIAVIVGALAVGLLFHFLHKL